MNKTISQLTAPQGLNNLLDAKGAGRRRSGQVTSRGRSLVIVGWLISMLGVAAYCLAMLDGGATVDPYSTLFQRGPMGIVAAPLLLAGTICWIIGAVKLLEEVDRFTMQNGADKQQTRD